MPTAISSNHIRVANALARRQHGVVTRRQLAAAEVIRPTIERWISRGLLVRMHRGVYCVGHDRLTFAGHCMAVVFAVGGDAHITGAAATYLRGAEKRRPAVIDVVTTSNIRSRVRGARVRVTRALPSDDRSVVDGVPTASASRSLVDLAATCSPTRLASIMHELEYLESFDAADLRRCVERCRTRRGRGRGHARVMAALALIEDDSAGTQSRLERRVLDDLLEAGVVMPRITPLLELEGRRTRPDLVWMKPRLAVEVDGTVVHGRTRTRNNDRIKTERLERAGYRIMRIREEHRVTFTTSPNNTITSLLDQSAVPAVAIARSRVAHRVVPTSL